MKNLIMFVYGDFSRDSRAQRTYKTICNYFNVRILEYDGSYLKKNESVNGKFFHIYKAFYYLGSIIRALIATVRYRPKIVWGNNNYSLLWIWLLKKISYRAIYVYDDYELYIPTEKNPMKGIGRFFYQLEMKIVNNMDLTICASEERADIMFKHFLMKKKPLVIRNISKLEIIPQEVPQNYEYKLDVFFEKPKKTIVYAGVISSSGRGLDRLIHSMNTLKDDFKLLIVGAGSSVLEDLLKKYDTIDYLLLEAIPYKGLGAVLSRCDIGYVYYPTDTINNTYCASNKVYEYSSLGLPMIANENPTLIKIINKNGIGICSENIADGIKKIIGDYTNIKNNCLLFSNKNSWEKEATNLLNNINALYVNPHH